jgi:type IV secretion system protein VirB10
MRFSAIPLLFGAAALAAAQTAAPQEPAPAAKTAPESGMHSSAGQRDEHGWRKANDASSQAANGQSKSANAEEKTFTVQAGTKIPLSMINSVSTKSAAEGDRVYLETVFPILVDGRVVIPPGSYVAGTVTESKRPGRVKGRGELYVRFDSLTLPNGTTRDFRSRIGTLDGRASEELDKSEGKIKSEGDKSGDARTVGATTAPGASVGALAGSVGSHAGMGAGIGAAAGAAAGLMGVLLSRGPEAVLAKGTTLEMVLDRPLTYTAKEIEPAPQNYHRSASDGGGGPLPSKKDRGYPYPGRTPLGWPY